MAILPSWYQEVEYIQSTATDPWSDTSSWQYIDTLVTINKNIKVDIDMQFTSLAVQSRLFWWLYDSWSSWITFWPYINWSTQRARATANWLWNWQSTSVAANTNRNRFVLDNTRYIIYNSSWTQVYNGTNSSTISNSDTWTIPLLASKDRSLNRVSRHSSAKLYWCKIWDNNVLVRDFVPCYRKSDNEIWLYDLVNNQFYTNQWTGTFTKWPNISPDWKIKKIYLGTDLIRPKYDVYYSDKNREEYQSLVNSVGSVQFVDTGRRYRFGGNCCYIWNRIAVNITWWTTFNKVNLDTLTVASTTTISMSIWWRIWNFWDNRILTRSWILDFDWNVITNFWTTYTTITPWLTWVVWANNGFDIYKWIVDWDNITFTKIWTSPTDQSVGQIHYWRLWAYLFNWNDNSWSWNSAYVNPETNAISTVAWWSSSRQVRGVAWADGKEYRCATRYNGFGKLQKVWTASEWFVWNSLSTSWSSYWVRFWKFLWNIVSGWMNSNNWTGNWYWSNSYFIGTDWTLTLAQSNAFAYDTSIFTSFWFIDENGRIYPNTAWWWTWVILKTNKTFTDLNWRNPFLWR